MRPTGKRPPTSVPVGKARTPGPAVPVCGALGPTRRRQRLSSKMGSSETAGHLTGLCGQANGLAFTDAFTYRLPTDRAGPARGAPVICQGWGNIETPAVGTPPPLQDPPGEARPAGGRALSRARAPALSKKPHNTIYDKSD